MGLEKASGHLDFYPNGGRRQPGCPDSANNYFHAMFDQVDASGGSLCNHLRAITYYLQSKTVPDCLFVGRVCDNFQTFQQV